MLPSWLVVYYVLALASFMDMHHHRDSPSGPRQRPSELAHHPPAARPLLPCPGRLNDPFDRCPRKSPRQQPYRDPVRETVLVPQYLLTCTAHAPKLHPCNLN